MANQTGYAATIDSIRARWEDTATVPSPDQSLADVTFLLNFIGKLGDVLSGSAAVQPACDICTARSVSGTQPKVAGHPFRCSCSGNVFKGRHDAKLGCLFVCNACGAEYQGE